MYGTRLSRVSEIDQLRVRMARIGLTQAKLAEEIGVGAAQVSYLLTGRRRLQLDVFRKTDAVLAKIVDMESRLAEGAREGFRDCGKERHPAGLNFGDCFSRALATELSVALLYKGSRFQPAERCPGMSSLCFSFLPIWPISGS